MSELVWRWRRVRNPYRGLGQPGPPTVPSPLAHRHNEPVRVICRGRNGNLLLEFGDGFRVVAPRYAAGRATPAGAGEAAPPLF